jgi:hypothetical protein
MPAEEKLTNEPFTFGMVSTAAIIALISSAGHGPRCEAHPAISAGIEAITITAHMMRCRRLLMRPPEERGSVVRTARHPDSCAQHHDRSRTRPVQGDSRDLGVDRVVDGERASFSVAGAVVRRLPVPIGIQRRVVGPQQVRLVDGDRLPVLAVVARRDERAVEARNRLAYGLVETLCHLAGRKQNREPRITWHGFHLAY